ncbi:hypothetical protein D3C84_123820 [compost metagenome]
MILICAGDIRRCALRPGGDDHPIGAEVTQQGGADLRAEAHVDGQVAHLVQQVVEQLAVLRVGEGGEEQGAAEALTALQ